MKLIKFCLLLCLCLSFLIFAGCKKDNSENGDLQTMKFGKNLTITVLESETIDAEYLQHVLDGEVKKDVPYFDLWDSQELIKMIDYMKKNNLMLVAGQYTFNQAWKFDNGFFVLNNNEKREIFKFKPKNENQTN